MANNLDLMLSKQLILNELKTKLPKLDFVAELSDDGEFILISCKNVTLKGIDDNIFVEFLCYKVGASIFRFVFDKIQKTEFTLNLVNSFNMDSYCKAYISDSDYLTLENFTPIYSEQEFVEHAFGFLNFGLHLSENEIFQQLATITR